MISIDELDKTILELETNRDTTYATCERLAWLYIVRDHISGRPTVANEPIEVNGNSDFINLINGKNSVDVIKIIDELMTAIYITNRNLYDAVMAKLQDIDL